MAEKFEPDSPGQQMPQPYTRRSPARSPSVSGFSVSGTPNLGIIIGARYIVEGFLGEGGTAVVYLARDSHTDQLVVVKRMKAEVAKTPELRRRFLFEAHALSKVRHPGVIRVLDISDVGESHDDEEAPYLVLEALRGESLGDYLKRHDSMSIELSTHLMRQAAYALSAVHEAGLVHRDIKPDNLYLVGPIDEPQSVKVLDFGMAHLVDEGHDESSTDILGTVQYMPPEQILVEPVDARTDIYALGVVMFRMLTGHLPFDAPNKHNLLRHQLFSPVPPASWLNEEIPMLLEKVIHKATRKAPAARFSSMAELADAFDGLLGMDEPPSSRRLSTLFPENEAPVPHISTHDESGVEWTAAALSMQDPDIYLPVTQKGRQAAEVLAVEFGIYSRPHRMSQMGK